MKFCTDPELVIAIFRYFYRGAAMEFDLVIIMKRKSKYEYFVVNNSISQVVPGELFRNSFLLDLEKFLLGADSYIKSNAGGVSFLLVAFIFVLFLLSSGAILYA